MPPGADIASQLDAVRRRITAAAHRAHRPPASIQLIAVSKTVDIERIRAASTAGQIAFGENRVQEAATKVQVLLDLRLDWHLIGHLQSNKAKKAVETFGWIHSLDRIDLVQKVDRAAAEAGVRPRVLLQVDLAREATKHGAGEAEIGALAFAAAEAKALDLRGLMIIPPNPETPEASRPWFRQLRELRDRLVHAGLPADQLAELSMGMSQDFEIAIEEGATMVRVGTAIFGDRVLAESAGSDD